MTFKLNWDNDEKTLFRFEMEGKWTWDEYHQIVDEAFQMIRPLDHTVDVIVIGEPRMSLPSGSALAQLVRISRVIPNNIGLIVLVTPNGFIKAINRVLFRMSKRVGDMTVLTDTVDEAYAVIWERRAKRAINEGENRVAR